MIHVCEVRHGGGSRTRILASRENVRGEYADFDILAIRAADGVTRSVGCRFADFPRAAGIEALFGALLRAIAADNQGPAHDESGNEVAYPEATREELIAIALYHSRAADAVTRKLIEMGERIPGRRRSRRVKAVQQ